MPNRHKTSTVLPLLGIPLLFLINGCAITAPLTDGGVVDTEPQEEERCDRMDNDGDALVDEDFRNDAGDYIDNEHCGWCNNPCVANDVTQTVACEMTPDGPTCVATECKDGYIETGGASCVPWDGWLCLSCLVDEDCGPFEGARCESVEGELRCATTCIDGVCPEGYACKDDICLPESESCICGKDDYFKISCTIEVNGEQCMGTSTCENGMLSACQGSEEVCDQIDNDCDGLTDEPFVDSEGRYTLDLHHCGACGVDCTLNESADLEIICGGSWVVPRCALLCADSKDGLQIGDFADADLDPNNGCECQVQSFDDIPGVDDPNQPDLLDANCDGADGVVNESIYVIPAGNDDSLGTPTEPLATIGRAIDMALASLNTEYPRPHIFVAAGVYSNVLHVINGIHIHGSYRPDFLKRSDTGFATEIHAPSWSGSPGGAALVADPGSANVSTFIDGLTFSGASAQDPEAPAFGVFLNDPGPGLRLSGITVISGDGSDGTNGEIGTMGERPPDPGYPGDKPKLATEDSAYDCLETDAANRNNGGMPSLMQCGAVETAGGEGGSSYCARNSYTAQASGVDGKSVYDAEGGKGGSGGWNATGPIDYPDGTVFCGLADFEVSSNHETAADGEPGENGQPGLGGSGCQDALGVLDGSVWEGAAAFSGESGLPGGGAGGGGAGGSVNMTGYLCDVPYPDGIGGGGGGGGAGGCGGEGGTPGTSGGPSVGMVLYVSTPDIAPQIIGVQFITGNGGHGGRGGHGGDGGLGSAGGEGGKLLSEERSIPPLSGADSGGNGGTGGNGGRGGGGGGGCGGSVIGIWLIDRTGSLSDLRDTLADQNSFTMGVRGSGGEEGVGGISGTPGLDGEVHHVVNR